MKILTHIFFLALCDFIKKSFTLFASSCGVYSPFSLLIVPLKVKNVSTNYVFVFRNIQKYMCFLYMAVCCTNINWCTRFFFLIFANKINHWTLASSQFIINTKYKINIFDMFKRLFCAVSVCVYISKIIIRKYICKSRKLLANQHVFLHLLLHLLRF